VRRPINAYIDCQYKADNGPEDNDDTKTAEQAPFAAVVRVILANLANIKIDVCWKTEGHYCKYCDNLDGLVCVLGYVRMQKKWTTDQCSEMSQ